MHKRLSFAYLTPLFTNQMGRELYFGIKEELQKSGVDLTVFIGDTLKAGENNWVDLATNSTYELAKTGGIDGIIVYGGAIGHLVGTEELDAFCSDFSPIPVVNISLPLENTPSVIISNYQGMFQLTEHLISTHQCKSFAFIQGPKLHDEAEQRYSAFCDALAQHQLILDPALIQPGNFSEEAGKKGVIALLEQHDTLPDVIICVDDDTALGAINELKARSISVPADIIVTGFDDALFAKNSVPSITSVKQPFQTLGKTAAQQLLAKVKIQSIPSLVEVEALPAIHESCGCFDGNKHLYEIKTEQQPISDSAFIQNMLDKYDHSITITHTQITTLLDSLKRISKENNTAIFYSAFSRFFEQQSDLSGSLNQVLSFLNDLKNHVKDKFEQNLWITLFQQATLNTHSIVQRNVALAQYQSEDDYYHINFVNQQLHQATSLQHFYDMSYRLLPAQKINSCAILLYQGENKTADDLRMTFAYNQQRIEIPEEGLSINLADLCNDFFQRKQSNVLIMPLSLSNEKIGLLLLELDDTILDLSQAVSWHFSSIIKRLQTLVEKEQKRVLLENTLQDLRQTQERLIETEKLASLGKLVADVAHEMNTPLGVSITYSSLIVDTTEKIKSLINNAPVMKSELNKQLELLKQSGEANLFNLGRSADLINSFKSLSVEHDVSQLRSVVIKEEIENALLPMHSRLNKGRHRVNVECDEFVAHTYPKSIIQVLMGLIDNSICHAYPSHQQGIITITAIKADEKVVITYQDDGCGISQQDREQILEPFYTTKRNQGHVGLGLTTIHNIIKQQLQGQFKICDTDKGTKIILSFPAKIQIAPTETL